MSEPIPEPAVVNPNATGEWNPGEKYRALVHRIQDILSNGEKRTVRDCYYALESRGNKYEYRYVKRAVKKGRRAGYIRPDQIIDASRSAETTVASGYEDPRSFLNAAVDGIWNAYDENVWAEQENYVEIWLEKQSLASVFAPICREWNVRLEATRGDWSDSKVYEATTRLRDKITDGKDVHILYFGDFNPSGYHAPVSTLNRMAYYGLDLGREEAGADDPRYYDVTAGLPVQYQSADSGDELGSFHMERVGITLDHIQKYDLPENPNPSSTDKDEALRQGFMTYVSEGRDTNVELNALKEYHRDDLESMVRESIRDRVDEEAKQRVEDRIAEARNALSDAVEVDESALDGREF